MFQICEHTMTIPQMHRPIHFTTIRIRKPHFPNRKPITSTTIRADYPQPPLQTRSHRCKLILSRITIGLQKNNTLQYTPFTLTTSPTNHKFLGEHLNRCTPYICRCMHCGGSMRHGYVSKRSGILLIFSIGEYLKHVCASRS